MSLESRDPIAREVLFDSGLGLMAGKTYSVVIST